MHTHVYDISVQFGADIWATAKREKKIKHATSLVVPNLRSEQRHFVFDALRVVGLGLEETGHGSQAAQRYHFIHQRRVPWASMRIRGPHYSHP